MPYVDASHPLWRAEARAQDQAGAIRDGALAGLRLLILAGDDLYQRFVEETASHWGIAHSHAERAPEALEMLRAAVTQGRAYDLCLIDDTGAGNGISLAREIGQDPLLARLGLLILSDRPDAARRRWRIPHVLGVLTKPLSRLDLHRSIGEVLERGPEVAERARVLIVDDDAGTRFVIRSILANDGYRIEEAEGATQALALCERRMPDLVLMDAHMPETDGFTACTRIRDLSAGEHLPVLVITALDDEHTIDRAFGAGATDYISKPMNFAVLRMRVARLLAASRAEERVRRLAFHDPLTGLPNRMLFRERLLALLARGPIDTSCHAVLFLDLDRFKLVNDTLGHETGDLLLKAVAERITGCVRACDLVARLGGDEFTIILERIATPEVAAAVARKIVEVLSYPFGFLGQEIYVGASVGIALYPNDGRDIGTLLKHADMAMYRAKEDGNRFVFYKRAIGQGLSRRLALERNLRHAQSRDELRVYYQPQIDARTAQVVGMEALVRWAHPRLGLLKPARFIPLAEETGLIVPIAEWVLRTACAQNRAWQDSGLGSFTVAVNVSARQLVQNDLERQLEGILGETGLSPQYLELELTEGALMRQPEDMQRRLLRVKQAGCRISIDDFGTGYSSLSYLKHFPFDRLKVDQSFVRRLTSNPDDAAITRTIIAMGHVLRLRVVAEGVETEAQLRYLQRLGCDEVQGFYISQPLTAERVTAMLHEDRCWIPKPMSADDRRVLLIVDDDTDVVQALLRQLGSDYCTVLSAQSAGAAFDLLATHEVRVVISDQRMPGIDGVGFLSRVRELYPETVRMLLTAHADLDLITEAVNKGWIYEFITKPWEAALLRQQLREAFAHYEKTTGEKASPEGPPAAPRGTGRAP
ncbi:MAG: EAL domain-containing protein [Gammaproteobacteria bacterium]